MCYKNGCSDHDELKEILVKICHKLEEKAIKNAEHRDELERKLHCFVEKTAEAHRKLCAKIDCLKEKFIHGKNEAHEHREETKEKLHCIHEKLECIAREGKEKLCKIAHKTEEIKETLHAKGRKVLCQLTELNDRTDDLEDIVIGISTYYDKHTDNNNYKDSQR